MSRHWKSLLAPSLLSVLLLASCEPRDLTDPRVPTAALSAESAESSQDQYTFVTAEPLPSLQQTVRVIDEMGGMLELLGHVLTVPAGAVAEPTQFSMVALPDGRIEVELAALSVTGVGAPREVGADGFLNGKTVRLTLSYATATNVDDPSRLLVLYLMDGGAVEALPTSVDVGTKTVSVELEHFSRYCMAMD